MADTSAGGKTTPAKSPVLSTVHRRKLKESDNVKYLTYLQNQKTRCREYRIKVKSNPDKIQRANDLAKKRQKAYRERKKDKKQRESDTGSKPSASLVCLLPNNVNKKPTPPKTRSAINSQRYKWRIVQQKHRKTQDGHKRKWARIKDKERKARARSLVKISSSDKRVQENHDEGRGYTCKKTLYNITSKARKVLPNTPRKFSAVLGNLVNNTTPRKRKAAIELFQEKISKLRKPDEYTVEADELEINESIQESVEQSQEIIVEHEHEQLPAIPNDFPKPRTVNPKTTEITEKHQTLKSDNLIQEKFKWNWIPNRIKKIKKFYANVRVSDKLVKSFYLRPETSTVLPQKRYATKNGPGYVMQMTLKAAFAHFKTESPDCKVGFTKFTLLRPKNVRLLTRTAWNFCTCSICQNVTYKLNVLSRLASLPELKMMKIRSFQDIVNVYLCQKSDGQRFHLRKCIFDECERCGHITDRVLDVYQQLAQNRVVTWNHWERKEVDGKMRKVIITKREIVENLLQELISDLKQPVMGTTFARHLFNAQWQQMQFLELNKNLPCGWILMVMDFGKNREVRHQDECKSAFFSTSQITVHPVVLFYRSPDVSELIVRDSQVYLTDDNSHDHHAVDHFFNLTVTYLQKSLEIQFTQLVVYSDGCSGQYKSKGPFADLSLKEFSIHRNYFGSDHGKSECDGELGSINRAVDMAIIGRKIIIRNAAEMHQWCKDNLNLDEAGSKRSFVLVKVGEVERVRVKTEVKTLPGTRKLHHLMNMGSPYQLKGRELSCYCICCRTGSQEECVNAAYVKSYVKITLKPVNKKSTNDQGETVNKAGRQKEDAVIKAGGRQQEEETVNKAEGWQQEEETANKAGGQKAKTANKAGGQQQKTVGRARKQKGETANKVGGQQPEEETANKVGGQQQEEETANKAGGRQQEEETANKAGGQKAKTANKAGGQQQKTVGRARKQKGETANKAGGQKAETANKAGGQKAETANKAGGQKAETANKAGGQQQKTVGRARKQKGETVNKPGGQQQEEETANKAGGQQQKGETANKVGGQQQEEETANKAGGQNAETANKAGGQKAETANKAGGQKAETANKAGGQQQKTVGRARKQKGETVNKPGGQQQEEETANKAGGQQQKAVGKARKQKGETANKAGGQQQKGETANKVGGQQQEEETANKVGGQQQEEETANKAGGQKAKTANKAGGQQQKPVGKARKQKGETANQAGGQKAETANKAGGQQQKTVGRARKQKGETVNKAGGHQQEEETANKAGGQQQKGETANKAGGQQQKEETANKAGGQQQKEETANKAGGQQQKGETANKAGGQQQKEETANKAGGQQQKEETANKTGGQQQKEETANKVGGQQQEKETIGRADTQKQIVETVTRTNEEMDIIDGTLDDFVPLLPALQEMSFEFEDIIPVTENYESGIDLPFNLNDILDLLEIDGTIDS